MGGEEVNGGDGFGGFGGGGGGYGDDDAPLLNLDAGQNGPRRSRWWW